MDETIKITTNCSGDWTILEHGNYKDENHRLDNNDWADFLRHLGYNVVIDCISDEEMESRVGG